ncbi:hypothetical protein F444_03111 [Phytophthora nicotianae P1976]|nr:hypothetical protein F444_03111 [Phytophthora nicotianae P1976]
MSRKRSVAAVGDDNNLEDNEREEKTDEGSRLLGLPNNTVMYVNSLVVYSPSREKWLMTKKLASVFRQVGAAYIMGACVPASYKL